MNCFEARKEFPAFWRRTLAPIERARLTDHLAGCPQCDRSFRTFALSAPLLHSEGVPGTDAAAIRPPLNLVRPSRFVDGEPNGRRGWRPVWQAAAAALLLAIGGLSAWSSTRWPVQNFAESVISNAAVLDAQEYSSDALDADSNEPAPALFDSIVPESALSGNRLAG
jgi:hypothetical protein